MHWWAWVIAGAILLGAELSVVNAQFYLVFIGGAAIVTGLAGALVPDMGAWIQWAIFAVLALVSMTGFRSRVYLRLSAHAPAVRGGTAPAELTLPEMLAPGATCQVEHAGSFWTVRNDGATPLAGGERAHIVRRDGLTLDVRSARKVD
jgi:membrane protein implicated in regulation of membrane protease activity